MIHPPVIIRMWTRTAVVSVWHWCCCWLEYWGNTNGWNAQACGFDGFRRERYECMHWNKAHYVQSRLVILYLIMNRIFVELILTIKLHCFPCLGSQKKHFPWRHRNHFSTAHPFCEVTISEQHQLRHERSFDQIGSTAIQFFVFRCNCRQRQ